MNTSKLREYVAAARSALDSLDAEIGHDVQPPPVIEVHVRPGDDVAAALRTLYATGGILWAAPGDYPVSLVLPPRASKKPIVISTETSNLPAAGVRITRDYAPGLAMFRSWSGLDPAFEALPGSGGVSFLGVGFGPQVQDRTVVMLGDDTTTTAAQLPTDFLFDRVLAMGDPNRGQHRWLMAHAANVVVQGCAILDFFEPGRDSQAIAAWNGGRNLVIDNNRLEGGAENLLLGGSDAKSVEMIPQDIRITRNLLTKPLRWQTLAPENLPSIKSLLELKNAQRVHVEGNVLDGNWSNRRPGGSWASGVAVILKVSPNGSLFTKCEDVTVVNNVIRNAGSIFTIVGSRDGGEASDRMRNVRLSNNVAYQIGVGDYPGDGKFLAIANPPLGLHVEHNTARNPGTLLDWWWDSLKEPGQDLIVVNNIAHHAEYGIRTEDGSGVAALQQGWPGSYQLTGNALRRHPDRTVSLPPGNSVIDGAAFDASFNGLDLLSGSAVAGVVTTDGLPIGANLAAIGAALSPTEMI